MGDNEWRDRVDREKAFEIEEFEDIMASYTIFENGIYRFDRPGFDALSADKEYRHAVRDAEARAQALAELRE